MGQIVGLVLSKPTSYNSSSVYFLRHKYMSVEEKATFRQRKYFKRSRSLSLNLWSSKDFKVVIKDISLLSIKISST